MTSWQKNAEKNPRIEVRNRNALHTEGRCVVYWMQRAQRADDNPALNLAIEAANELGKPAVVYLGLRGDAHHGNFRHYQFMMQGLEGIGAALGRRNVAFVLRRAPEHGIARFCAEANPCLVVGDEDPQRRAESGRARAARELKAPFWTVDGDAVVPSRLLGKEHYAARTIRPKIHALLAKFLKPLSNPVAHVRWRREDQPPSLRAGAELLTQIAVDRTVAPVPDFCGGSAAARQRLAVFIRDRLAGYALGRNQPELDGTSQLSPYLHFGQIGPRTVALAVSRTGTPAADRNAFLEEFIVRRELAVNFVRYNPDYDRAEACEAWAEGTLREHAVDARRYRYDERQL